MFSYQNTYKNYACPVYMRQAYYFEKRHSKSKSCHRAKTGLTTPLFILVCGIFSLFEFGVSFVIFNYIYLSFVQIHAFFTSITSFILSY